MHDIKLVGIIFIICLFSLGTIFNSLTYVNAQVISKELKHKEIKTIPIEDKFGEIGLIKGLFGDPEKDPFNNNNPLDNIVMINSSIDSDKNADSISQTQNCKSSEQCKERVSSNEKDPFKLFDIPFP